MSKDSYYIIRKNAFTFSGQEGVSYKMSPNLEDDDWTENYHDAYTCSEEDAMKIAEYCNSNFKKRGIEYQAKLAFGKMTDICDLDNDGLLTLNPEKKNFNFCELKFDKMYNGKKVLGFNDSAFAGTIFGPSRIIIPSYKRMGKGVFSSNKHLKSITFEDDVEIIPEEYCRRCELLSNVHFPNSLREIGGRAFFNCSIDGNLVFPEKLKEIGVGAFYCSHIENIVFPKTISFIGAYAFYESYRLKKIEFTGAIPQFEKFAFSNCRELNTISFKDNTSLNFKEIPEEMFSNCLELENITIPEGVETIDKLAFFNCRKLKEISFPDSLRRIEEKAFDSCINLKTITINNKINYIHPSAFNIKNDVVIYFDGDKKEWHSVSASSSLKDVIICKNEISKIVENILLGNVKEYENRLISLNQNELSFLKNEIKNQSLNCNNDISKKISLMAAIGVVDAYFYGSKCDKENVSIKEDKEMSIDKS